MDRRLAAPISDKSRVQGAAAIDLSSGTPSLLRGVNVSSLTDTAVGNVTINWANALNVATSAWATGAGGTTAGCYSSALQSTIPTTTSMLIFASNSTSPAAADLPYVAVVVFRN